MKRVGIHANIMKDHGGRENSGQLQMIESGVERARVYDFIGVLIFTV